MAVLVTGGGGFIGSHVVTGLVRRKQRVRIVEHPDAQLSHLAHLPVEVVRADIRCRSMLRPAIRGCREVYHLAANPQLWTQRRGAFRQTNFLGAVNVFEEALAAGVRRLVHVSTESILTRKAQQGPIAEEQHVQMRDIIGPYCRSKFLAERAALRLARCGAPIVIVNPTLPVGPGDRGRSPPTQLILDFCHGKRHEYLDADLNLVDVRDVAEGVLQAMDRGKPGRRYILGHENLSVRSLFCLLSRLTGLPVPTRRVPYPVALAAAYASEWAADVFTHHCPAATVTGVKLARRRMHFDASRSLAELGIQPRPVEASLRDAVHWFHEVGWLPG